MRGTAECMTAPSRAWRPMNLTDLTSGFVVSVQTRYAAGPRESSYWCGHVAWDSFVNWLHYRDPVTGDPIAAPVAVYATRSDAASAWQAFLSEHRPQYANAVVDVMALARIPDLLAVPVVDAEEYL